MVFICAILSCKGIADARKEVLPLDTMKVVIWDLLNADEWNNIQIGKDTSIRKTKNNLRLYQKALLIHHISKDQFYYSYSYYEDHPDQMKTLMDTLSAFGQKQKEKFEMRPVP